MADAARVSKTAPHPLDLVATGKDGTGKHKRRVHCVQSCQRVHVVLALTECAVRTLLTAWPSGQTRDRVTL